VKRIENPELGKRLIPILTGFWSLGIEDCRAIYEIRNSKLIIVVVKIGLKKNAYGSSF
jgi:mRNA-degrading endonuclease RelE of RelBE toxin-antitoxin system